MSLNKRRTLRKMIDNIDNKKLRQKHNLKYSWRNYAVQITNYTGLSQEGNTVNYAQQIDSTLQNMH